MKEGEIMKRGLAKIGTHKDTHKRVRQFQLLTYVSLFLVFELILLLVWVLTVK